MSSLGAARPQGFALRKREDKSNYSWNVAGLLAFFNGYKREMEGGTENLVWAGSAGSPGDAFIEWWGEKNDQIHLEDIFIQSD